MQRSDSSRGTVQRKAAAPSSNPFTLVRRMFDDMDRMFEGFTNAKAGGSAPETWSPAVEVFERSRRIVVRADLPGIKAEDIRVHVDEDALYLEGERHHESEREEEGVYQTERTYGSFQRRIPLPRTVDVTKETVTFEGGVLEISFGMKANGRRAIPIGAPRAPSRASAAATTLPATPQSQGRDGTATTTEAPRH